ncbi:hypothetical protein AVEN_273581-1 [Araneus ventricosus]|uniref:Uncharacterized protein n=1 Tax=Araneus ventricosus TaxID=182803 RepID=A0A4Y2PXW5_ARAVE|nr:hypothetical protein AVEN_273581-1 [Araneus ventricosus]
MMRTTSELAPFSKLPHHTTGRAFGSLRYDLACSRPIHDGSSMESGFEPRTNLEPKADTLPLDHRGPVNESTKLNNSENTVKTKF